MQVLRLREQQSFVRIGPEAYNASCMLAGTLDEVGCLGDATSELAARTSGSTGRRPTWAPSRHNPAWHSRAHPQALLACPLQHRLRLLHAAGQGQVGPERAQVIGKGGRPRAPAPPGRNTPTGSNDLMPTYLKCRFRVDGSYCRRFPGFREPGLLLAWRDAHAPPHALVQPPARGTHKAQRSAKGAPRVPPTVRTLAPP